MNQTRLDQFMAVYEPALREYVTAHPEAYGYGPESVAVVASKMRKAFERGSYNKDSKAIQRTCKVLGIAYTYKGINEWLNQ